MALVAKLEIVTVAPTGQMEKGFARGAAVIEGFGKKLFGINVAANLVSRGLSGLASNAINTARSAIGMVADQFSQMASINQIASSLGMSTEALVGWQEAADDAGMSAEEFQTRLIKMQDSIGSALSGNRSAAESFARLGISTQQLSSASTEERMYMIADSIQRLGFNAQTAAALTDIFGRKAGPEMLQMLGQGRQGLQDSIEGARRLGLTFSALDASKVELGKRAIKDLGDALDGIARQLSIVIVPYLQVLADSLTSAGESGGMFGESMNSVFSNVASAVVTSIKVILAIAQPIYIVFKTVQIAVQGLILAIGVGVANLFEWIDSVLPEGFKTGIGEAARAFVDEQKAAVAKIGEELQGSVSSFWASDFGDALDAGVDRFNKAAGDLKTKRDLSVQAGASPQMPTMAEAKPAGATLAGSVEAYSAILKARQAQIGGSPEMKVAQQQLAEQKNAAKLLGQIDGKIGKAMVLAPANL